VSPQLTLAEARRLALAAQGFDKGHRDSKPHWPALARTLDRIHLLQLDSVNVLVRSHYLPLFSRHGNYAREALDQRASSGQSRAMFECWAHEASLVPLALHPLLRWRMLRARNGDGTYKEMDRFTREEKDFLRRTRDFVEDHGPVRVRDIPDAGKAAGGWWGWSKGKLALETLFNHGLLTTAAREGFERIYDIPERVIPKSVLELNTPPERDAFHHLIVLSAQALGVATEVDLRDYFRLPVADARSAIEDAVATGEIRPVQVEGWKQQAFMHHAADMPKAAGGIALLSPFDPIVWNRDRAERLFGFHYRIELYTPAADRKFGYYVLPFLCGEQITARLCLKADRQKSTLRVNSAHLEAGADAAATVRALRDELALMARWLGLDNVKIGRSGQLANPLRKIT
jgi:uncharacterized protein YcaQ